MFPPSSLTKINEMTHGEKCENRRVSWFLVTDENRFHTYVKVVMKDDPSFQIRIDWHDNSTLCFEPFLPETKIHESILIGERNWFCRDCIIKGIESDMRTYKLFQFNCRTVSYIILTKICRFSPVEVEKIFYQLEILCGLDERECISPTEISHYIAYTKSQNKCTLF